MWKGWIKGVVGGGVDRGQNAESIPGRDNRIVGVLYNGGRSVCGSNSVVECQLPKLDVAGSNPVSRSIFSIT